MKKTVYAVLLVLIGLPAAAQQDPMEVQRCVWSCLANHGPNTNPAYHQCVERVCVPMQQQQQAPAAQADARERWIAARTSAGVGYAGVDGRRDGTGLYYFCGQGQSFLRVVGIDGGERGMIIDVDGRQFPLSFRPNARNQPESTLAPHAPVMQALQSGNRVKVLSYELGAIVDAPLRGSSRALAQVISGC
ncbi:hypothetical protein ACOXXX_12470 [Thalassococcus sp. BH17M4-6]|uniref:hypothetical protein n=1 Tax=Thalassococcus sp. BH17M4-6 TaxID=3413148 RepID=UPI003BBE9D01